jgi:hypothetical protein
VSIVDHEGRGGKAGYLPENGWVEPAGQIESEVKERDAIFDYKQE